MFRSVLVNNEINPFLPKHYNEKKIHFGRNTKILELSSKALIVAEKVSATNLEKHLNLLAGAETEGRGVGQKGIEIAKKYIADKYKEFGLKPVENLGLSDYFQNFITTPYSTNSYRHSFNNTTKGSVSTWGSNIKAMTSNVLGMIKGSEHPDEFIIISAHYDHLGKDIKTNVIFPGADDNASGVSALMEIAKIFSKEEPPKKSIIFAALTGK